MLEATLKSRKREIQESSEMILYISFLLHSSIDHFLYLYLLYIYFAPSCLSKSYWNLIVQGWGEFFYGIPLHQFSRFINL